MPVIAEGTYEVDVDLRKFDRGLDASVRKAQAVVKAADKATKDSAKLAEKAAAEAARAVATKFKAMEESAKKAFEQIGGRFGSLGSAGIDLGKALGAVGGPVLGIAAMGAAATGAVVGMVALANSAVEAKGRLEALGIEIDRQSSDSLAAYAAATGAATIELDKMKVAVGGEIAGRLVLMKENVSSAWDAMSGWGSEIRTVAGVLTGGMTEALIGVNAKIGEYADKSVDAADKTAFWKTALLANTEAQLKELDTQRVLFAELDRGADWRKAAAEAEKYQKQLQAVAETPLSGLRRPVTGPFDDETLMRMQQGRMELEVIAGPEIQQGLYNLSAAVEATSGEMRKAFDTEALQEWSSEASSVLSDATSALQPYADALSNMFDMADQRAEEATAKLDKLKEKNKSIREEMRNTDDAATRASLQLELEANKVAQDQARAAARIRKQQALRAWRGEKAGNITMAIANGAVAVTQAFAQLGPIAGAFAAIGVAAATATQVGLIASQKPPQYHTGGRFGSGLSGLAGDEMQATVLRNEGAVTARGVRAAGGDKGLRELSKGRMPGGETVVHNVIQIGDRVIARETRRHTPGQLGQSNPHRR